MNYSRLETEEQAEQFGYDSWVEEWVSSGCSPTARSCPARFMPEGDMRWAVIRGWNRAKKEAYP